MNDPATHRIPTADCRPSDPSIATTGAAVNGGGATADFSADQKLVFARSLIAGRSRRFEHFDTNLFADPAWDIMLELFTAETEGREVPVTNLCYTSNVPDTTILRWIKLLCEQGLLVRHKDEVDKRRVLVQLSMRASKAMDSYVCEQLAAITKAYKP